MVDKMNKVKCTGCKMCADLCPNGAITFNIDKQGFWYPHVDEKKCVKCGLCIRKCPVFSGKDIYSSGEERKVFAAWSNDDEVRKESTSGGLYYEFASAIIEQGGYIVGSVYAEDFCSAYHTYAADKDGLLKIMGSKYFQSDTAGIYKKTAELLAEGKRVIFTGSPCQVAALNEYLGGDRENLITLDFICRAVPSPLMQKKKIELYQSKARSKVTYYRDKSKYRSWRDFGELVKFENGRMRFISRWKDDINDCFIHKNLNCRESCYQCIFKDGNNASDITIGDFWGIQGVTEKDLEYGVSVMIANTEKGMDFISSLGDRIYYGRRTVSEIKAGNKAYFEAPERPEERDTFYETVNSQGLEAAVNIFTGASLREKVGQVKRSLKAFFKPYEPLIQLKSRINWFQFIHYNFWCKGIKRNKHAFLIPCWGSVISIAPGAELQLSANLRINHYYYKRGNQRAVFQMGANSRMKVHNRVELAYGTTMIVNESAELETGYFYTGIGADIICNCNMKFGNNIMIGRDVCIFDSDYHRIYNEEGHIINQATPVVIEDNVWIGARSMVLKGARIHEGAIVSANSMVTGEVEGNRVFINRREAKSVGGNIIWER